MHISKKNEVYLQISNISSSQSAELSDFFTFEVPGFKFMPAYRNRVWDGKIRLFSPASGEIYVGLLPYIKKWSKDKSNLNSYQWDIVHHYLNIKKRPFSSASWTVVEPNCHFTK